MKSLAFLFCYVDFDYIPRALNGEAYRLAKFCFFARQDVGWKKVWLGAKFVSFFFSPCSAILF